MATYSLSGTGTQTLTTGTGALYVTISTLPSGSGNGGANPADYYGIGLIRPGNATAFWEPWPVIGGPQWMPVPYGTTRIGYALFDGAVLSVAEVIGSSPLAFPLASLPDVAIASPSDAQVLAYQASSSKWINATPTGGGGSGPFTTVLHNYTATSNLVSGTSIANKTWTDLTNSSRSFTVTNASATIVIMVSAGVTMVSSGGNSGVATRLVVDSTNYRYSASFTGPTGYANPFAGALPLVLTGLSAASHTVKVQLYVSTGTAQMWCEPSSLPDENFYRVQILQMS